MGVAPDGRFTASERAALVATVVSGTLVPLNSTMIAVGLPDIARAMNVEAGRAAVLVTAYLVAMLVCQPIGGRAGDRFGHRRVAAIALAGFGVSSVVAALAPAFPLLLAARCGQAVFGASFSPNMSALLRHTIDPRRRGRAFGLMGSGIGSGAAIGPVLGGALIAAGDWRWMFAANVPIVLIALPLVVRLARTETHGPVIAEPGRVTTLDLLKRGPFLAACATQTFSNFCLYSTLLVLPIVLTADGWTSGPTGAAVSALTLGMLVLSPAGGRAGDSRGRARVATVGMSLAVAGCAIVAGFIETSPLLVVGAMIIGSGQGIASASLQTAAVEAAPLEATASAAGIYSTSRYVGSIASSLLIAALAVSDAASSRPLAFAVVGASVVATLTASRVEGGSRRAAVGVA